MEKLPTKIKSITCFGNTFIDLKHIRNICYVLNEDTEDEKKVCIKLPELYRPKKSETIVDDNNEFCNGFKVVKLVNGEYGYVRENDNLLLPYRYDVAFDFNDYGFAIVGKDGCVSWIDKDFRYLNLQGRMVEEDLEKTWNKFESWQEIYDFSEGNIPLSRLYCGRSIYRIISYFDTNGKIKDFYKYDGEVNELITTNVFLSGTTFDENGRAMAGSNLLFARGYYISYNDIIKLCEEKGYIQAISEDAEKYFDKDTGRILKKDK